MKSSSGVMRKVYVSLVFEIEADSAVLTECADALIRFAQSDAFFEALPHTDEHAAKVPAHNLSYLAFSKEYL